MKKHFHILLRVCLGIFITIGILDMSTTFVAGYSETYQVFVQTSGWHCSAIIHTIKYVLS